MWYFLGSTLDFELDRIDPGLGFRCNDDDRSTMLIKLTRKMAQVEIQNYDA